MNLQFKSELNGGELFKKIIVFLIAVIVSYIAFIAVYIMTIESVSIIGVISTIALYLLLLASAIALGYQFIANLIPAVSLGEKKFEFNGTLGDYMIIHLKGLFLSIVTLGIYGPWYQRNITSYLADSVSHDGKNLAFNGTGGKLLKYTFLGLFLPGVIIAIIVTPMFIKLDSGMDEISMVLLAIGAFFIYFVGIFATSAIYYTLFYKWLVDFNFGDEEISLDINLGRAIGYMLGQFGLALITWGLYMFAAEVTIFRYFTNRVKLTDPKTGAVRRMRFNGDTGTGFGLIFVQFLLTTLTVGIYGPWAYANIYNWFISNVEIYNDVDESEDLYKED